MSRSLYITCEDCKERLWIGQRDHLYLGEPHTMQALQEFLNIHECTSDKQHSLNFKDDNADDDWYGDNHDKWKVWNADDFKD